MSPFSYPTKQGGSQYLGAKNQGVPIGNRFTIAKRKGGPSCTREGRAADWWFLSWQREASCEGAGRIFRTCKHINYCMKHARVDKLTENTSSWFSNSTAFASYSKSSLSTYKLAPEATSMYESLTVAFSQHNIMTNPSALSANPHCQGISQPIALPSRSNFRDLS
jgi:hypothetical protein